jgi:YVTN family beta-propeller protein
MTVAWFATTLAGAPIAIRPQTDYDDKNAVIQNNLWYYSSILNRKPNSEGVVSTRSFFCPKPAGVVWSFVIPMFFALVISCGSEEEKSNGRDSGASRIDANASAKDAESKTKGRIYVVVAGDNEVIAIDEESRQIIQRVTVGVGPAIIVATADFSKLFTANWTDNTVSIIDAAKMAAKQISVPGRPYVIAIAPDGKHVYAGLSTYKIVVVSTETDEIEQTFSTTYMPASIIVSNDSTKLYVADLSSNTLRALSASNGDLIAEPITVGLAPAWITITPDGSKVYTLNYTSDDITVVDTKSFTIEATIATGTDSKGIIGNVTPDGSRLFVTNLGTGDFIAVDTKSNEIVKRIDLGARPVGVTFSQDSKRVYVTDHGAGSLDSPTSAGQAFLLTGVFTPVRDGQVRVFDTTTYKQIGENVVVGAGPNSVVAHSPLSE